MKLHEIMSAADRSFTPENSVAEVVNSLAEKSHSCKVICENGKPKGILTEHDMVHLFATYRESGLPAGLTAGDVMTKELITFATDLDLAEAISLFKSHSLRHLPVVNPDGVLVGLITLPDMVKAYLALSEKHSKLEELSEELHWLSLEDTLTGLPNRRAMEIDLVHAEAVSQRRAEPYAIALIDIDLFKPYNDHYGHPAGDDALRSFAAVACKHIRASDKLFRYGGEEFLFLMPATNTKTALIAANRFRQAVSDISIEHCKSPLGHMTVSMGVASCRGDSWKDILLKADSALYLAKSEGRNTVCTLDNETEFRFPMIDTQEEERRLGLRC